MEQPADQEDKEQQVGNYLLKKTLGEGTFGKVKLGIHLLTDEKVAVKIFEKKKIAAAGDQERVSREIEILKRIKHQHIIRLYEIIESAETLYLIMEYAEGGELFEHIVTKKRLQEAEACKMF